MWFRRRHKLTLKPFDESALPKLEPVSLEDATDEGLMLTEYASRMLVRNRIVIGALTGDEPYEQNRYADVARSSIDVLADEATAAAERIADERSWAAFTVGNAEHVHDYRAADAANLERREELSLALAQRLHERRADEEYLAGLVERARSDAWREIAVAIEGVLDRRKIPVDATYERERAERMRLLVTEDLEALFTAPRDEGQPI